MPPVFGPVSPSPMRLWSCAIGRTRWEMPSVTTWTDISRPTEHSSITNCAARFAENALVHDAVDGLRRLARGLRDDDALPGGEPVGLQDLGIDIVLLAVGIGGKRIAKTRAGCGGQAMLEQQFLGKDLAAFEPRGGGVRTEDRQARFLETINNAGAKRRFGTDKGQVGLFLLRPFNESRRGR